MLMKFIWPSFKFNIERWKWNKEFRIFVSNMGNFKDEHKNNIPLKIDGKKGYVRIKTPYGLKFAHRLVLLTWKPIPNAEDMTVDHLDHNKRNNALDNLEWVDKEENWRRAENDLCQVSISQDCTKRIRGGNIVFEDFEQAIHWLENHKGLNQDRAHYERIKNKIHKACKNHTKYHDIEWEYIIK